MNQWKSWKKKPSDFHSYLVWCVPSKAVFCPLQLWSHVEVLVSYNFKVWLHLSSVVVLHLLDKHFPFFSGFPSFCFQVSPTAATEAVSLLLHCYATALLLPEKCLSEPLSCPWQIPGLFIMEYVCFLPYTACFKGNSGFQSRRNTQLLQAWAIWPRFQAYLFRLQSSLDQ